MLRTTYGFVVLLRLLGEWEMDVRQIGIDVFP
jgi:hypothetical protein